jgi:hypothetical protein
MACQRFCGCIYDDGKPLSGCLIEYRTAQEGAAAPGLAPTTEK